MRGSNETKNLVCGCICVAMINIIFSMGFGGGYMHIYAANLNEMNYFIIAYYILFLAYNFFTALRLVWHKHESLSVLLGLTFINMIYHMFPGPLNNYELWYLVPNWIYFIIQFLAIPLLFNTFMHLRTKNSFDRYMIERRGKTRQQENPTPHTHFIPRGLQDSTKIKAKDVLTDANSEEEAEVLFTQDENKANIYTVDV